MRCGAEENQSTEQIKTESVFRPSSLDLNLTFILVCILLHVLEDAASDCDTILIMVLEQQSDRLSSTVFLGKRRNDGFVTKWFFPLVDEIVEGVMWWDWKQSRRIRSLTELRS